MNQEHIETVSYLRLGAAADIAGVSWLKFQRIAHQLGLTPENTPTGALCYTYQQAKKVLAFMEAQKKGGEA